MELRLWLAEHTGEIWEKWHAQIRARGDRREGVEDEPLRSILRHLAGILPATLGDRREEAEELWQAATHLYGSLAGRRGLAAGEVVEELQLLREVILRFLLQDPPEPGFGDPGFSRELLILNRALDLGIVQASVAYTDELFFAHLQGSGIPGPVTADVSEEVERQLSNLVREVEELGTPRGGAG